MKKSEFLNLIHRRLAQVSVGSSALRNQGAKGLVGIARGYLENSINYDEFFNNLKDENRFNRYLDKHTLLLLKQFPKKGKSWGASRKALNLFFRESVYNKFITDYYKLPVEVDKFNYAIMHLEIPLDKDVAKGINNNSNSTLPKWTGIKNLTAQDSSSYQIEAKKIADLQKIAKVHLDLLFWRQ